MTRSLLLLSLVLALCVASTAVAAASVVSGRIASLSGEAEKGAVVRAFTWDAASKTQGAQAVEEATTDAQGAYTFAKLADGQAYRVVVKSLASGDADSKIVRATPEWHLVRASAAPVTSLNFVSFRRAAKFDLTGEIVGLASSSSPAGGAGAVLKHLATLEVSVALATNPGVIVASTKTLSASQGFFAFYNLPAESYVLSVKTSLSSRTYSFASHPLQINLREGNIHVQPVVDIGFRASSVSEMQGNSLWNGLLIVAALMAILYKERSVELLKAGVKSAQLRNPAPLVQAVSALFGARSASGSSSYASSSASESAESKKKGGKFPGKKEKTHVSTFVKTDRTPLASPEVVEQPAAAPAVRAEKEKPARQSLPAPAPKPQRVATPAPPAAAPSPAATPSPPPAQAVAAAPAEQPKKIVSPKPVKAPKASPVAAAAAAPAPIVAAAAAPAPVAAASSAGPKFCSECGHKRLENGGKFCAECGHKF